MKKIYLSEKSYKIVMGVAQVIDFIVAEVILLLQGIIVGALIAIPVLGAMVHLV